MQSLHLMCCILATIISVRPTLLVKEIAKVLNVHHHNVVNTMEKHKVLSNCSTIYWQFHFGKKMMNVYLMQNLQPFPSGHQNMGES